jgi:hypothetical protein
MSCRPFKLQASSGFIIVRGIENGLDKY